MTDQQASIVPGSIVMAELTPGYRIVGVVVDAVMAEAVENASLDKGDCPEDYCICLVLGDHANYPLTFSIFNRPRFPRYVLCSKEFARRFDPESFVRWPAQEIGTGDALYSKLWSGLFPLPAAQREMLELAWLAALWCANRGEGMPNTPLWMRAQGRDIALLEDELKRALPSICKAPVS